MRTRVIFIIFLLVLIKLDIYSQAKDEEIITYLDFEQNIDQLLNSIDSIRGFKSNQNDVYYRKGLIDTHRYISDSIVEHVVDIEKIEEGRLDSKFNYLKIYTVCITSYNDDIGQVIILLNRNVKKNYTLLEIQDTLLRYDDYETIEKINEDFYSMFKAELTYSDLYNKKIYYGFICHLYENRYSPKERSWVNERIHSNDYVELVRYMKSPNIEKQIFGYEGILFLERSGYQITNEVKDLIEILKDRNSSLRYCDSHVIRELPSKYVIHKLEKWFKENY